jgi:hypothetical protein
MIDRPRGRRRAIPYGARVLALAQRGYSGVARRTARRAFSYGAPAAPYYPYPAYSPPPPPYYAYPPY